MKMSYEIPIECDLLCDDYFMQGAFEGLQIARLEHLLMSGNDLETAYEMSELEREKRQEAYRSGDFVRSILGVLERSEENGEQIFELKLKWPGAFK